MKINRIFFAFILAIGVSSLVQAGTPCDGSNTTISVAPDINKVLAAYLTLKDALVASNETVASEAAMELKKALFEPEGTIATDARDKAIAIAESNNLANQRALFYPLSESILALVKASKDKRESLYVQYCPMAFDNEGAYWLSESKDVLNPYFGDQMLRCGMVKEKL